MNPPAFQFYAQDFYAGAAHLSQAEAGAYIRLLCHQWTRGSLPNDLALLKRLAGGPVSAAVLTHFDLGKDGAYRNLRLEAERSKQAAFREQQAKKGKASVEARLNRGSNSVEPPVDVGLTFGSNQNPTLQSSSSSSEEREPVPGTEVKAPAQNFERPKLEEFVDYMVAKAGIPEGYAADRWGRYDATDWTDGKGAPIVRWRSLAPSLQTQFRADSAKPDRNRPPGYQAPKGVPGTKGNPFL